MREEVRIENGIFNLRKSAPICGSPLLLSVDCVISVVKPSSNLVARQESFDEAHPAKPERLSDVEYKDLINCKTTFAKAQPSYNPTKKLENHRMLHSSTWTQLY